MNPPESENSSLADFDQNLIAIFLKELIAQVKSLQKTMESLHEKPQDKTNLEHLRKKIGEIIQGGKIIRIDPVVKMGKSLENLIKAIAEEKVPWGDATESCLHQILDFLRALSLVSPAHLDSFLRDKQDFLSTICSQMEQIEKVKYGAPAEKELHKEPPKVIPSASTDSDLDARLYEIFRVELETQSKNLSQDLIDLERKPKDSSLLEKLMRTAHSIKGAARVVALIPIVRLAHAMEDCFVAAQQGQMEIHEEQVDQLLKCVDVLSRLAKLKPEKINAWSAQATPLIDNLLQDLTAYLKPIASDESPISKQAPREWEEASPPLKTAEIESKKNIAAVKPIQTSPAQDRVLRITAENLNRLMGLAGESLVESRWLYPFGESLQKYKSNFKKMGNTLDALRDDLRKETLNESAQHELIALHDQLHEIYMQFTEHLGELENFRGRYSALSDRLYQEVVNSRMRPFADGVEVFPRMVRDLGRQLGKQARLEIVGKSTQVDRDILEKLESPLNHLLRNAVVHGIETPEERLSAGKPSEGVIVLEARHQGGMLAITVSDDGRGIDIEHLRQIIIEKKYSSQELAKRMTATEIIDFLCLPGFSTSTSVSDISGRGVGLNIVQNTVQEVGGTLRISSKPGKGASFHLQLPVTLSVIRILLVEISGEAYAFPLSRIEQSFTVEREEIMGLVGSIESRQFFRYEDQNIGLVSAWEVLELEEPQLKLSNLPVIIVSDRLNRYALVVDRLIGEKELVVQELDPRLGKIPDVLASAVLEDGSPVLILDAEDIVRTIDNLLSGGRLTKLAYLNQGVEKPPQKKILIVDDSITVREVECRLLKNQGYEVETAVNGMDGWNALRLGHYDLVISDVDMPRMNGIELLKAIKSDPALKNLPVMIVSYKSSEEDRLKGLEAGADYYLTKSSFHDTTLIDAVADLIGKA